MNATLQVLRSIPEMQENLNSYVSFEGGINARYTRGPAGQLQAFTTQDINSQGRELTSSLRDLYQHMSETPDAFNPARFLQVPPLPLPINSRCFEWRSHNSPNEVVNQMQWPNKTPKNVGPKSSPSSAQTSRTQTNKNPS